jgi:hypothetical protein
MQRLRFFAAGSALAVAFAFVPTAGAQCVSYINFEDYPAGTQITTQYDGVTFSSQPGGTCPPEIEVPFRGTSSGTKALFVPSCPEFSNDYLRMVFDDFQPMVSFTFGEWGIPNYDMLVRAYTTPSGPSGLIYAQTLEGGDGVVRLAVIGAEGGPRIIKRVEVETVVVGAWECIDDLRFGVMDTSPPVAQIATPTWGGCHCDDVVVTGIACDEDGYAYDRLEYRSVGAAPDAPWIFINEVIGSPVCETGFLYTWDTTSVPHGRYFLRLTAVNACGLESVAFQSVFVDKHFANVQVTSPADADTVCGIVEFLGSVNDGCQCFDHYTVEFSDSVSGPYEPVDPSEPMYFTDVKNGQLATWDTLDLGLPNDTYYIRITGVDSCENTQTELIKVTLLNGPLCGCPSDINDDGVTDFQDLLALLSKWGPCP